MSWWWGYTETVSPRPPRLHRISTIFDRSSRSCPPVDVRFALKATELMRGGEMSEGPKEDIGSFWAHGFRPKRPGSGRAWLTRAAQRLAIAIEHERKRCLPRGRAATTGRGARPKELRLSTRCVEQPPATPPRASYRSWVATEQSRPRLRESQRLRSRSRLARASAANPPKQARNSWASGPAHGSPLRKGRPSAVFTSSKTRRVAASA